MFLLGLGEVDERVQPSGERLIEVGSQIRRQDGDALELLHPLQEIGYLDIRVAIVRVANL